MGGTALVTGAAGFTGRNLSRHLMNNNWEVTGTDLEAEHRSQFYTETDNAPHPVYDQAVAESRTARFLSADLTKPETLEPLFETSYDTVFHVASLFDYFADRETLWQVNVDGAKNIARLAAKNGVNHFVHFSTLGVLADAGFDEPSDEQSPYDPHNVYCESKQKQEETLRQIANEHGLRLTILRPAPIYGPGNQYGVYHIPLVVSKLGFAPVYRIYPRSKQLKFPSIHVADLCRMAQFVTEHRKKTIGESYNAVSDCIGQDSLINFIAKAVDVPRVRIPIPYVIYKQFSGYAVHHSRRIQRIAQERGKRPKIDAPITKYLSKNMWFSNAKIRDQGFEFLYRDPRRGLWQYITWCKEEGLLP